MTCLPFYISKVYGLISLECPAWVHFDLIDNLSHDTCHSAIDNIDYNY